MEEKDGLVLGEVVGEAVGMLVGEAVGLALGDVVGREDRDGFALGEAVGLLVEEAVGLPLGNAVVGLNEGVALVQFSTCTSIAYSQPRAPAPGSTSCATNSNSVMGGTRKLNSVALLTALSLMYPALKSLGSNVV